MYSTVSHEDSERRELPRGRKEKSVVSAKALIASLSIGVLTLSACATGDKSSDQASAPSSVSPSLSPAPHSASTSRSVPSSTYSPFSTPVTDPLNDQLLSHEELSQKAARLIAVGVKNFDDAKKAVDEGVRHIFITSNTDLSILNGQGPDDRSLAELQRRTNNELTVSVDEEGGSVQRLSSIIGALPSARELGATATPDEVRDMMAEHARKMADLGITMDFAPDVDLDSGGTTSSNAIGDRAFSSDPKVVTAYGRAVIEGFQSAGIVPVIKHFPGHGRASGDSHTGLVTAPSLVDLENHDLRPFAELAQIPGVAVMVGHLKVYGLGDQPTSINPAAYSLLRSGQYAKAAPFQGIAITDDLTGMKAISGTYTGPEAAVAALSAGADVVLTTVTGDTVDIREAIVKAVQSGTLSQERILESVERSRRS